MPAETWLGKPLGTAPALEVLIARYFAAFGPATIRDVQTWSGLTGLRTTFESMRPNIITFADEEGNELFDVHDALQPDPDTPPPPRFLPVFDNVLLSHSDRRSIMTEAHRKVPFGTAALLEGTVLIDGFVGAKWKILQGRGRAVLAVEAFAPIRKGDREAISDEGAELLRFALSTIRVREVRITKPIN